MGTRAEIDGILADAAATEQVAGVVAMAADRDGVLYQGAFGKRSLDDPAPMTADTVFWIHSMTKAITATACMQLVEQGRLDLDAPASAVMPAVAQPQVLEGFDASGAPRLRPARGSVTLRNLLTHSSGFVYDTWNADRHAYLTRMGGPRLGSFTDAALVSPLAFDPGSNWQYGTGIDWAGKMLEAVSGQSLDAYLRAHVFDPLGMHDTGFLLTERVRGRLAGHHDRLADGTLAASFYDAPQDPEQINGGGGLFSTAADYMRFLRMLLAGGELDGARLLRAETVATMGRNHLGDVSVRRLTAALPAMSNDVDLYPGMTLKWGLSFLINTQDVPGARRAGSLAWAGLRNTYFWIDPAAGITGLLLTQVLPFADAKVLDLLGRFESGIYALAG